MRGAGLQSSAQRDSIWQENADIADAINARDAERAVQLTEQHTTRARSNLLERLGDVLES